MAHCGGTPGSNSHSRFPVAAKIAFTTDDFVAVQALVTAGLGVARIFALTYVPGFFARLGYAQVPKETLPHKVWTVCVHCDKFADCDELAVEKRLSDAPIQPMRLIPILEVSRPD